MDISINIKGFAILRTDSNSACGTNNILLEEVMRAFDKTKWRKVAE